MNNTGNLKSFSYLENGEILFSNYAVVRNNVILDPGSYILDYANDYPQPKIIFKKDGDLESYKEPIFEYKELLNKHFQSFFDTNISKTIKKLGFYHKTGVLLYGKEGTGKTSIIKYYCNKFIEREGAIVIHLPDSSNLLKKWDFINKIRQIQSNPIVIVIDEIDEYMKMDLSGLKQVLDGKLAIDNSIVFGMTNYINQIPTAIKDRPSRFKYCLEIGTIDDEKVVLEVVNNLLLNVIPEEEILELSKELKGCTIDIIKQKCIDKIMNITSKAPKRGEKKLIGFLSALND